MLLTLFLLQHFKKYSEIIFCWYCTNVELSIILPYFWFQMFPVLGDFPRLFVPHLVSMQPPQSEVDIVCSVQSHLEASVGWIIFAEEMTEIDENGGTTQSKIAYGRGRGRGRGDNRFAHPPPDFKQVYFWGVSGFGWTFRIFGKVKCLVVNKYTSFRMSVAAVLYISCMRIIPLPDCFVGRRNRFSAQNRSIIPANNHSKYKWLQHRQVHPKYLCHKTGSSCQQKNTVRA